MSEVIVIVEGQTEEAFIKQVIAPLLYSQNVFIKPLLIKTSKDARGGAITYDRFKLTARNTLRTNNEVYVTTFLDFYGLDTDFPGYGVTSKKINLYEKVTHLEESLHSAIVSLSGCRPDRFLPHIQPHEFEALLFSDVDKLVSIEPSWHSNVAKLRRIRDSYPNPEHINNSFETKPSRRLIENLSPTYRKTTHGPRGIQRISIEVIESECPHFKLWLDDLRSLKVA